MFVGAARRSSVTFDRCRTSTNTKLGLVAMELSHRCGGSAVRWSAQSDNGLDAGGIGNFQHNQWLPMPPVGSDDLSNQEWTKC